MPVFTVGGSTGNIKRALGEWDWSASFRWFFFELLRLRRFFKEVHLLPLPRLPPFRSWPWVFPQARRAFDRSYSSKSFCSWRAWRICWSQGKGFATSTLLVFSWCSGEIRAGDCNPPSLAQQTKKNNGIHVQSYYDDQYQNIWAKLLASITQAVSTQRSKYINTAPLWLKPFRQNNY